MKTLDLITENVLKKIILGLVFSIWMSSAHASVWDRFESDNCKDSKIKKLVYGTAIYESEAMSFCGKYGYKTTEKLAKATFGTAIYFSEIVDAYRMFDLEKIIRLREISYGAAVSFGELVDALEDHGLSKVECAHKNSYGTSTTFSTALYSCLD